MEPMLLLQVEHILNIGLGKKKKSESYELEPTLVEEANTTDISKDRKSNFKMQFDSSMQSFSFKSRARDLSEKSQHSGKDQ